MKTRSGLNVTKLKFVSNIYVGLVNGEPMTWNKQGRRTDKNKSKLDLVLEKKVASRVTPSVFYINITKSPTGIRLSRKMYKNKADATKGVKKNHLKTIAVQL
jgi:hypothetical protein